MYIAFDLLAADLGVNDKPSQAAWVNHILHEELLIWYQKHTIAYQIKTVKYVTRVVLEPDEMYSFFALTWNPKHPELRNYRMIEPMKLDNH
jgi:ribosomal protein L5